MEIEITSAPMCIIALVEIHLGVGWVVGGACRHAISFAIHILNFVSYEIEKTRDISPNIRHTSIHLNNFFKLFRLIFAMQNMSGIIYVIITRYKNRGKFTNYSKEKFTLQ